jgi:O-antigen ligase
MALTIVLGVISPGNKLARFALIAVAIVTLGLSQSGSSLLVLVLMALVIPLTSVFRLRAKHFALAASSICLCIVAGGYAIKWDLTNVFFFILDKLGKSQTLTGRGPLWFLLLGFTARHPWLGYGYDAFWVANNDQMSMLWHVVVWKPHNAHNGALQVVLDLGLVGLSLVALVYMNSLVSALKFIQVSKHLEYRWPLIYLVFFFAANIAEATIFAPHDIFWILFIATSYATVAQKGQSLASRTMTRAPKQRTRITQHA